MTFSVPAAKKSIKQNRWEFDDGNGTTYDVPLMQFAPAGAMEAFEAGKDMTGLLLTADTERTRDFIRTLEGPQIDALMKAWSDASGISVGESEASS